MYTRFTLFIFLVITVSCSSETEKTEIPYIADHALVVTAHPEASQIGLEVLRKGGNAVDAACAVEFALAVCYPAAGNIGGGGFMVARFADGAIDAIDYREKAPMAARTHMYLDEQGEIIEGMSTATWQAAGVPGTVDGVIQMHRKHGRLDFSDIIQPAIDLAEEGFSITTKQASSLNAVAQVFTQMNEQPVPYTKSGLWEQHDRLILPELAHTLTLVRDRGRDGFYTGETAERITSAMAEYGGLITRADLDSYQARFRTPVTANYKEYRLISMPPPSSGGVALIQMLLMTEDQPIEDWGFHSARSIHWMVETERRVYADRARYLGDPDFVSVPVSELTDKSYLEKRAEGIDMNRATSSDSIKAGMIPGYESEETTHYSVVDKEGNAVAGTTTLNRSYGTKIVVPGTGILLNNQMDDFSSKPGIPNFYGLIGGKANAIMPGKRMLSSMTPTILEKNGELFMVVGSPGGSTIITSVYQTILNVIEFEMNMQAAVSASRFHHQWYPDHISYEKGGLDIDLLEQLSVMGHAFRERSSIGRVDAILVRQDGRLEAGADPRGDDTAAGY